MNKVILSVLGHDRPGIVAAVARILFEQHCNIENVSQTILQTEFAGSFILTLPPELLPDELRKILIAEGSLMDMHVHIKPIADECAAFHSRPSEPFVITTKGPDRKGLVAGISAAIARYGINITNLQAVFKGGDAPGNNIMIYEVDIPIDVDQQRLRSDLKAKGNELNLEVNFQHKNIFEAMNRI